VTKNPYLNALGAIAYIVAIVLVIRYGLAVADGREETIMIPIAMISLFTLSAAVMGYIFLLQPIRMYLDGERKEAVDLFLKTVVVFAGFVMMLLFTSFSGLF
jgi:hypothetical protein